MYACRTLPPSFPLQFASPTDMSGKYGLTEVKCDRVVFEGSSRPSFADYRAWVKTLQVLKDAFEL